MSQTGGGGGGDAFADLPPISYVWQTPIRRPKRQPWDEPHPSGSKVVTPAMQAKLARIVRRAPEVMVKITGRTKGVDHLKSHLEYITRNGELSAETETGAILTGRPGLRDLQQRWTDDVLLDKRRANGTLSVNMILSMPSGTDAIKVQDAVRAFAIDAFEGRHDYVFVLHQDDMHPHVHLTVRSLGYDGKRLNPRKADLACWRESFAGELRLRGIEAEATPRRTRGRIRKADRGKLRAMKERKAQPRVEELARSEIAREVRGAPESDRAWEKRILERQETIRRRYLEHANELKKSGDPGAAALGQEVEAFVRGMPVLRTRRHELRQELASRIRSEQTPAQDRASDVARGSRKDRPDRDR